MKSLSLFTLTIALAVASSASAQDEKREKARARPNAGVAKFVNRAAPAQQPRAIQRGQNLRPNFNANTAAPTRAFRSQGAASYNSDVSVGRGGRPFISRTPRSFQPRTPVVSANNATTFTPNQSRFGVNTGRRHGGNRDGIGGNRDWRNGRGDGNGVWNGASADWQNRNGDANNRLEHRRRGDHHQDFHNRHEGDPNFALTHSRWHRQHQDRSWWRSRYNRFTLFGGGYYYWDNNYWYPAYGYDPYFSTYTYDAPIYGYNDQEPGQVIANVQAELQRRGYEPGGVDGEFGPMTRRAILDYQQDNGLPVTGEIDETTLNALGLQ